MASLEDEVGGARGCLFVVAAALGIWGGVIASYHAGFLASVAAFFIVGLGYTLLSALAVQVCKGLRWLAFPGASPWDGRTAVMWGSVWPLSLVFWLIVTPFFALINRLFR